MNSLTFVFLLTLPWTGYAAQVIIPVDVGWQAESANGSVKVPSTIPGGIYTDLQRAGVITDPYFGFNDVNTRWVAYDNWTFSADFQVTADALSKNNIWLQCDGLDTVATVLVNDVEVGKSENMFVRYSYNLSGAAHTGTNNVKVKFQSPVIYARVESETHKSQEGYNVPPECTAFVQNGECHPNFIRKTQSSFSWDWGPAFPAVGILKPVKVVAFNSALVQDVLVSATKGNEVGPWTLNVTVVAFVGGSQNVGGKFKVEIGTVQKEFPASLNCTGVYATQNLNLDTEALPVNLWWPNGYGEQTLYNLTVTFTSEDGTEQSSKRIRFGFRTIELVQDTIANKTGLTFYFKVNDVPIFMKGSNWIPADSFPERMTYEYTRNLLQSTKDANMNMLRVWGGGLYETDNFYNIADELGILIWQDMMFACAMYPKTDKFLGTVSTEITQQVQRLQHHASVAVWAGNNENEAALVQNWFQTNSQYELYKGDYLKLYVETILPIIQQLDESREYLSSSPSNGDKAIADGYVSQDPGDMKYGDIHYYNYMSDMWNEKTFPRPRFASEYGFQAWPSFENIANVSVEQDWNYGSNFARHRQHLPGGNDYMIMAIQKHLPLPAGCPNNCTSVEQFKGILYLSQIYQAVGIQTETEHYRRAMSEFIGDEGKTMGGLYWQLADIWQAPTWASLEFGGKWKMLHYYAKNFFSPALASHFVEGDILTVYGVSDLLHDANGVTLNVDVYKWDTLGVAYQHKHQFDLLPSQASQIYQTSITELFQTAALSPNQGFVQVSLVSSNGSKLSPRNTVFPVNLFEAVGAKTPNIVISNVTAITAVDGAVGSFEFVLVTDAVSAFLWLETPGIRGRFSDNGFHLVDAQTIVQFHAWESTTVQAVASSLKTYSLADIRKI